MHELIGGLTNWVYTTSDVMSVVAVPWPLWDFLRKIEKIWEWINTYENTIFSGMNSYLPAILL